MAQSAKAQEPSMEDILASIRRIIADDETKAKVAEPATPVAAARPQAAAAVQAAPPAPASAPPAPTLDQDDIDTVLSGLDLPSGKNNGSGMEESHASVLDLTESMAAPAAAPSQPPVFRTIQAQPDVFFSEENAEPAPEPAASEAFEQARRRFVQSPPEKTLMSTTTTAAVDSAFNTLAHTVLAQNARTLEDLVKEMMRPMLKAWLDDNLPSLVERLVRAEIERVSRGRQG
jgi:cell pole-organizing protein PopZ